MIKKILEWEGWSGLVGLVVFVLIIGGIWYFSSKEKPQSVNMPTPISEEMKIQLEKYDKQMGEYCSRPVNNLTGVDLFRCHDYADYGTDSSANSLEELLKIRPDIPAFCDRKITEMKGIEVVDCLDENAATNE